MEAPSISHILQAILADRDRYLVLEVVDLHQLKCQIWILPQISTILQIGFGKENSGLIRSSASELPLRHPPLRCSHIVRRTSIEPRYFVLER